MPQRTAAQRHAQNQKERANQRQQQQRQHDKNQRQALSDILPTGLGRDYHQLIDKAVRNQWGTEDFERAVMHSQAFRRKFPGLMDGREISQYLSSGQGATTMATAVKAYNQLVNAYEDQLKKNPVTRLTGEMVGALVHNQISAVEFGVRASAVQTVKTNPGLLETFNEQLKAAGHKPIDQAGLFRFAAGAQSGMFYDVYEAAYLRSQGLNLTSQEAQGVAANLGAKGELAGQMGTAQNLGDLVSQIRATQADIQPELQRAGISDAQLTLLKAGQDPDNIGGTVANIIAQRRALQQRQGTRQGATVGEDLATLD